MATAPQPPSTIASRFWEHALQTPHRSAFAQVVENRLQWYSWSELASGVLQWIEELQRLAIIPGEPVASCLGNSLDWILLDLAAQTLGLMHVAIDVRETTVQQRQLWAMSGARELIDGSYRRPSWPPGSTRLSLQQAQRLSTRVRPAEPAQMLFTSGSAGAAKGVVLSHRNLVSNALAKLDAAPQQPTDVRLNVLPFAHAYARTCELSTWILTCGRLALAVDWADVLRQAPLVRPTLMNLVPYLAERAAEALESEPASLGGRLRLLQIGGAAVEQPLWRRWVDLGLPPLQGYGLTEASPVVCSNRAGQQRPGSVGPAVSGVQLRVDDDRVLWCRGPNVMCGYWQNPQATADAIVDGWLCTGDLADIAPDGYVSILGRANQQIVLSTGYQVSPEPIERQLCLQPGVARALVYGQGRPYVVGLLWPDRPPGQFENLSHRESAQPLGVRLALHPPWHGSWEDALRHLPRYAVPERFAWIDEPLSHSAGLLTAKGSLRRSAIADRYRTTIERLYAGQREGAQGRS